MLEAISVLVRAIALAISTRSNRILSTDCTLRSPPRNAASMRSSAESSIEVSAWRLRRAYSAKNQRPRMVSMTADSMAS
jgi:hypothetical protein